ncbi:MAG: hypothetical protein WCK57_05410 [Verrucomicrobiae bacterium]
MKITNKKIFSCVAPLLLAAVAMTTGCRSVQTPVKVARVAPEDKHAQKLVANAFRFIDPAHGLIDPASGYPAEGWNQDPKRGLFLHSFTQLTAIGERVELLACIAAGQADNPYLSREQALADLEKIVKSLRADQIDPGVSDRGLLCNFLAFEGARRLGPLTTSVQRNDFVTAFGESPGTNIWADLAACNWIQLEKEGAEGRVKRSAKYGRDYFDGALKPYAEQGLADAIMKLLDHRVVQIIFGDNANLTASVAKSIGALFDPSIRDNPRAAALRASLEQFLENQRAGYANLYDAKEGSFAFGWNATENRFYGWDTKDGNWVIGRMNYFINEFRGAWTFVVERYGLPLDAIRAGTFKLNPYVLQDGRTVYVPAAWEGSAFQILGLSLFMQELNTPGWRDLMRNAVAAELDYSIRNGLQGFLSESYNGNGTEYTGKVGIPKLAVTKEPRITNTPSLYTLGVAYSINPVGVEALLAKNWPTIKKLLTDHGPWEGWQAEKKSVIKFQTSAHTLALLLGFVGTGTENMTRYLQNAGLPTDPSVIHHAATGPAANLLAGDFNIFAWCRENDRLQQRREGERFSVFGKGITGANLAIVLAESVRLNLSGRTLQLRYRSATALPGCVLRFTPRGQKGGMSTEATLNLAATGDTEGQLTIPLPATPLLDDIKEIILVLPDLNGDAPLNLSIEKLVAGQ